MQFTYIDLKPAGRNLSRQSVRLSGGVKEISSELIATVHGEPYRSTASIGVFVTPASSAGCSSASPTPYRSVVNRSSFIDNETTKHSIEQQDDERPGCAAGESFPADRLNPDTKAEHVYPAPDGDSDDSHQQSCDGTAGISAWHDRFRQKSNACSETYPLQDKLEQQLPCGSILWHSSCPLTASIRNIRRRGTSTLRRGVGIIGQHAQHNHPASYIFSVFPKHHPRHS